MNKSLSQQFMKSPIQRFSAIVLVCLFASVQCFGGLIAGGKGVFRVALQLSDYPTGDSIEGATVTMIDAGKDELEGHSDLKPLAPLLEPTRTNVLGHATVYYYGGFSETDGVGTQQVRGKMRITKEGYVDLEVDLQKKLGPSVNMKRDTIPSVWLFMNKIKKP